MKLGDALVGALKDTMYFYLGIMLRNIHRKLRYVKLKRKGLIRNAWKVKNSLGLSLSIPWHGHGPVLV